MCVHPKISKLSGGEQNYACRIAVQNRKCKFRNELDFFMLNHPDIRNSILDIEDLSMMGSDHKVCPYFFSRENVATAEIVFLPYNYLVDPNIRSNLNLDLTDAVVIFDEAHNIEGVCSDAASYEINSGTLAVAISEIQLLLEEISSPELKQSDDQPLSSQNCVTNAEATNLIVLMKELEHVLDGVDLAGDSKDEFAGKDFPGNILLQWLDEAKWVGDGANQHQPINYRTFKDKWHPLLEKADEHFMSLSFERKGSKAVSSISEVLKFLKVVFKGTPESCYVTI